MIAIRFDVKVSTASLDLAARRMPRAISDAIVDTLTAGQTIQRREMATRFTIRRKVFADQSVKITEFPRRDRLTGVLAIAAPGRTPSDRADIFGKFERGGTKRPRGGRSIAVPIVGSPAKRTARTLLRDAWRPSSLLENGVPGGGRAYIADVGRSRILFGEVRARNRPVGPKLPRARKGQPAPVLRETVPLFVLVKSAKIDRRLDFIPNVTRAIRDAWVPSFTKRWNEQIGRELNRR